MRAILVATDESPGLASLRSRVGERMLPLIDRPFLQQVIEHLVGRGFTTFDVILGPTADRACDLLGDGARWGATIRQHRASDPRRPYEVLATLAPERESVLLGHADRLPSGIRGERPSGGPVLFGSHAAVQGTRPGWTGWAWIGPGDLDGLPAEADEAALAYRLFDDADKGRIVEVESLLDVSSYPNLLEAHRDALARRGPELLIGSRQVEPRTWVGRDVDQHPSARLVPPVFIGAGCRIGEGVQLGPNAVLGAGCLVDRRSSIADSVILASTYVGEGLEVTDSIVDRDLLINVRLGTEVLVVDETLLASLSATRVVGFLSRLGAATPASRLKVVAKLGSSPARQVVGPRAGGTGRDGDRERRGAVK